MAGSSVQLWTEFKFVDSLFGHVNMPSSRWCTRYVPLIFWFGHQVIVHVMGVHYVKVFWNIKPSWSNGRGIYPPKWQKDHKLAAILKMCLRSDFFLPMDF